MSSDTRYEHTCQQCGKSRFLSDDEANADGWRFQFDVGMICPKCVSGYGIPLTLAEKGTRGRRIYDTIGQHPDVSVNLIVAAVDQGYIP